MNDREQRRGSRFLSTAGLLLIAAALLLTGYNLWDSRRAGRAAEMAAQEVKAAIRAASPMIDEPQGSEALWDAPDATPAQENADSDPGEALPDPQREMPVVMIDGEGYIGVLEIPALSLTLPVIGEWSYPRLRLAPCRFAGSVYGDDMIIAAHNYQSHFGQLNRLSLGEEVAFTDGEGRAFSYRVAEITTLDGTALREMQAGEWDLTLFTCTVGGAARVTVRCERQLESKNDAP